MGKGNRCNERRRERERERGGGGSRFARGIEDLAIDGSLLSIAGRSHMEELTNIDR